MSSLPRPILFLDFDRTLFDTEKFYTWLGPDRYAGILALMSGERKAPDFSQFLYDDTVPFLKEVRKKYHLVLLSYAVNILSQRRKIRGTGISPYFADILITGAEKGITARTYIERFHSTGWRHVFVDDVQEHLVSMKKENPDMMTIYIDRTGDKIVPSQGVSELYDVMVHNLDELKEVLMDHEVGHRYK